MKGKRKSIFHYFITIILVAFVFVVDTNRPQALTNYYGVEINEKQYDTLVNLGFTRDEIYYMTEKIFNENKDADAKLLATTQKYYMTVNPVYGRSYTVEISEDEYYNHPEEMRGTVTTQYKTLISKVSQNGTRYRYKATLSWNNIPSNKSFDIIATGFSGLVHVYNNDVTFYFTYSDTMGFYTVYNFDAKQTFDTGASTTYELPSSFTGLTATQYFDVEKDAGAGTLTELHTCGDYSHSTTTVTNLNAQNHSVSPAGINLDASVVTLFDYIPCAPANVSVNW